jgi:YesN/AraC family two-component response regulator
MYFRLPDQQPEALLVIGPYLPEALEESQILELTERQGANARQYKNIQRYFTSLPVLPRSSHIFLLLDCFFDLIWGKDQYSSKTIDQGKLSEQTSLLFSQRMQQEQGERVDASIMEQRYKYENALIEAVRQGQVWKVENSLSRITPAVFEQRLTDRLREAKNYCIITNTILRKAAEQGGVHPMYIDTLSSSYAARIEQLTSTSGATALILEIARGYCHLVRQHMTRNYSVTVQKAILYINEDLSAELNLSEIAGHLNVNSSYLSALFKKETGSTITEYIMNHRISHAINLLESTRLQIQTVAQLCGFEDVHYFSRIFKKVTGRTPRQYRQADN